MLHVTGAVLVSHLATANEIKKFTDCAICVIGRSMMGRIVELLRGRPYGAECITNRNRASSATNE